MKITPVKGTNDYLPAQAELRNYLQKKICETYEQAGFQRIATPIIEDIENLDKSEGGDNLNLIFKVMKRGEKLKKAIASQNPDNIADMGLRYDLTLPLSRYYANNRASLPQPFKVIQMDRVYRAERPQKGRLREFIQCDIDILGDPSNLAEIELILATTTTLGKLGFKNFQIRINERRILKAMAAYSGFPEESYDSVFIILDKMDKIGLEGVKEELIKYEFSEESVNKYVSLFKEIEQQANPIDYLAEKLGDYMEDDVKQWMNEIIESVKATKSSDFEIVFDPTLVRGMSYYTGTIFEIAIPEFGGSCGGGGRYDKMVGKFIGHDVPACGFSIGFERIVLLLMEQGFKIPEEYNKVAYLIEKGVKEDALCDVIAQAQEERKNGTQVLVTRMNKNKKFQKEQLKEQGYEEFKEFYKNPLK